jgi:anti-sigma factor RsiW
MKRPHHPAADDLPAFALGALDTDELSIVAEHLAACPQCRMEVQSYAAVVALLALAAPLADPPRQLRQRLLASIQETRCGRASVPSRVTVARHSQQREVVRQYRSGVSLPSLSQPFLSLAGRAPVFAVDISVPSFRSVYCEHA